MTGTIEPVELDEAEKQALAQRLDLVGGGPSPCSRQSLIALIGTPMICERCRCSSAA